MFKGGASMLEVDKKGDLINHEWSIRNGNLIWYSGNEKEVWIPNGVTVITKNTFEAKCLNDVFFPKSVTTIEREAFAYNNLTELDIPPNIKFIEAGAFLGNKITSIKINADITIDKDVFIDNPIKIVRLTQDVKRLIWSGEINYTVNKIEIADYDDHAFLCALCPNLEALYIDNVSNKNLCIFLNKCHLTKKKALKQIFIKNEVSLREKIALKFYFPNIAFVFGYNPDIVFSDEPKSNTNSASKKDIEIQERVDKIYQITNLLNEKEKKQLKTMLYFYCNNIKKI